MHQGQFRHEHEAVGAEGGSEDPGGGGLDLADVAFDVALDFPGCVACYVCVQSTHKKLRRQGLTIGWIPGAFFPRRIGSACLQSEGIAYRFETFREHYPLGSLQRRVSTERVLTLQGPSRSPEHGVEAQTQELNVVRILEKVVAGLGICVDAGLCRDQWSCGGGPSRSICGDCAACRTLRLTGASRSGQGTTDDGRNRRGGDRSNRLGTSQTCLDTVRCPGLRSDSRKPTVIVDVVDAELRIVQLLGEVPQCEPPLAGVVGCAVGAARYVHEVGIRLDTEWPIEIFLTRYTHVPQFDAGNPESGVCDHRPVRTRPDVVGTREVAAHRIDLRLLPVELVESFHRQDVGRGHRQRRQPDRKQRLAQLRARLPQLAHVERVDGVNAVGDEGALTPVEHVPAEPHVDDCFSDVPRSGDVGVEHVEVPAYLVLRRLAQPGAFPASVLVLEVDESGGPDERAEVAGADVEVGGELRSVADDASVVVEIAVVAVGVGGQSGGAVLDPKHHAVRDRGIQAPLELPRRRTRLPAPAARAGVRRGRRRPRPVRRTRNGVSGASPAEAAHRTAAGFGAVGESRPIWVHGRSTCESPVVVKTVAVNPSTLRNRDVRRAQDRIRSPARFQASSAITVPADFSYHFGAVMSTVVYAVLADSANECTTRRDSGRGRGRRSRHEFGAVVPRIVERQPVLRLPRP